MIFTIIVMIALVIAYCIANKSLKFYLSVEDNVPFKKRAGIFFGTFFLFLLLPAMIIPLASLFIVVLTIDSDFSIENTYIQCHEIVSLRDGKDIRGDFFLGCGSLRGTEYYVYMKKYKDGGLRRLRCRTIDAIIYEKDDALYRIEWKVFVHRLPKWLFPDIWPFNKIERFEKEYPVSLIVPKNTVILKWKVE